MQQDKKYNNQKQFIKAIEILLPYYDWNDKILKEANNKCNFIDNYYLVLFPDGIKQIISFFYDCQDQLMIQHLNSLESIPQKIREKVALSLNYRIKHCCSKESWLKTNAYFIMPDNAATAMQLMWKTCNIIWHFAGDQSTDFNYYTKRGLLFSVYTSAILFYIADKSIAHTDTTDFINNALDIIVQGAHHFKSFKKHFYDLPIMRLL